ncbi:MAG: YggS family pyridoxal phosphate-dependent enzyme [Acidimicrobiia bacterium]|nr:YggS family pyridoxal phosphate-dependent enzyme [Acidimicrobiia bacterium]NNF89640.1 YggS family pyridoxal phosphate-dependent enzyme [Acidimicrobiia bacterium]NNL14001.1 YggS family pyridoxal phosphate-dependent enzyme [Acidimicrobiia bacterium]NNL97435.1 YggS family pyridoxal phosphate-dependent enzyme [Acidimicrobiia bacterium]
MSLEEVRDRMRLARGESGRQDDEVELIVVSKGRTVEAIADLYEQGQRAFGENRAQELVAKARELPDDVRWHFVGPLQRNKVGAIRPLVVMLHSLDRLKLADAWVRDAPDAPPALLEINLGEEPQKHGFSPSEVGAAADAVVEKGVDVRGVMAIPPHGEPAAPHFRNLVEIRDALVLRHPQMTEISAGMTDDFEEAIRAGATFIRVGRAIFD